MLRLLLLLFCVCKRKLLLFFHLSNEVSIAFFCHDRKTTTIMASEAIVKMDSAPIADDYETNNLLEQIHELTIIGQKSKRPRPLLVSDDSDDDISDGEYRATALDVSPVHRPTVSQVTMLGDRGVGTRWLSINDDTYLAITRWTRDCNGEWIQVPSRNGRRSKVIMFSCCAKIIFLNQCWKFVIQ